MPKFTHKKKSINPKNNVKPLWERYLEKNYFDPSHPGSFQGANKLHEAIKDEGKYMIPSSKVNDGYKIKNHLVFTNYYVDLFIISKLSSED